MKTKERIVEFPFCVKVRIFDDLVHGTDAEILTKEIENEAN